MLLLLSLNGYLILFLIFNKNKITNLKNESNEGLKIVRKAYTNFPSVFATISGLPPQQNKRNINVKLSSDFFTDRASTLETGFIFQLVSGETAASVCGIMNS